MILLKSFNHEKGFMEHLKEDFIIDLIKRYPKLASCKDDILESFEVMKEAFKEGRTLFVVGNGGSASDSEHIVGELMKGFINKRPLSQRYQSIFEDINPSLGYDLYISLQYGLPTICLNSHPSLLSAFSNDIDAQKAYAQQLFALGKGNDILLCITTSGNSINIVNTAIVAKAIGMKVLCLTGSSSGQVCQYSDVVVNVPETITYLIQELHLPIYHYWCLMLEDYFFSLKRENDEA